MPEIKESEPVVFKVECLPPELDSPILEVRASKARSLWTASFLGAAGAMIASAGILASIMIVYQEFENDRLEGAPLVINTTSESPEPEEESQQTQPAVQRLSTIPPSPANSIKISSLQTNAVPQTFEVPEFDPDSTDFVEIEALDLEEIPSKKAEKRSSQPPRPSPDAIAKKLEQKKKLEIQRRAALARQVSKGAVLVSRASPSYPRSAIRQHIQGKVVVAVTIGANGRILQCSITQSSGNKALDQAALQAAGKFQFRAAINGLGQPIATSKKIPFDFRLK